MIAKDYKAATWPRDAREYAGSEAEKQMAHYLHRRYQSDPEVYLLHQLRLKDADQREQDGSAGVCQIDHLVVHRWGFFLVESKSVIEEVQVGPDGGGGDEWSRTYRGERYGMPSPIRQARRQAEFLRALLCVQNRRTELLGRWALGARTVARVLGRSDQRDFVYAPMQLIVAISDRGRILRLDGWEAPKKPFRVFVAKADLVTEYIDEELDRHRIGANPLDVRPMGKYGLWSMKPEEVSRVAEFLARCHTERRWDRPVDPPVTAPDRGYPAAREGPIGKRFPNAGSRWPEEDDRDLRRLHERGWSIGELAGRFGRKPNAIRSRLLKLQEG